MIHGIHQRLVWSPTMKAKLASNKVRKTSPDVVDSFCPLTRWHVWSTPPPPPSAPGQGGEGGNFLVTPPKRWDPTNTVGPQFWSTGPGSDNCHQAPSQPCTNCASLTNIEGLQASFLSPTGHVHLYTNCELALDVYSAVLLTYLTSSVDILRLSRATPLWQIV